MEPDFPDPRETCPLGDVFIPVTHFRLAGTLRRDWRRRIMDRRRRWQQHRRNPQKPRRSRFLGQCQIVVQESDGIKNSTVGWCSIFNTVQNIIHWIPADAKIDKNCIFLDSKKYFCCKNGLYYRAPHGPCLAILDQRGCQNGKLAKTFRKYRSQL